jgi:hypothetical protein
MIAAGEPSTGRVVTVLSEVCPPHRGQIWSHHPRPRATQRGRKAKGRAGKVRQLGNFGNGAARDSIEAGVLAYEARTPASTS